jgi:hypothetical protein
MFKSMQHRMWTGQAAWAWARNMDIGVQMDIDTDSSMGHGQDMDGQRKLFFHDLQQKTWQKLAKVSGTACKVSGSSRNVG